MIVVTCPHCGGKFQGGDALQGTLAACPACRQQFTIPRQAAPLAPPPPAAIASSEGMSAEGKQTLKVIAVIVGVMAVVFGCPIGCCFAGRIMVFRAAESAVEFRLKYHEKLEALAQAELERRGCTDVDFRFSPTYDGNQAGGYLMSLVGACDYHEKRCDFKVEILVVEEDLRLKSIRVDGANLP